MDIPGTARIEDPSASSLIATEEMCAHCFDVIIQKIRRRHPGHTNALLEDLSPEVKCPLFVTWDKKHHSEFRLRGCIGTLAPRFLKVSLGEYAATSAFDDSRFSPIREDEVCHLRVGVSLLVNYENCKDCYDWDVGTHGIIIKFYFGGNHYNGTFLPEVSKQQNWTRHETIAHLVRKAGYRGDLSNELLASIRCTRYQSSKYNLTYDDYISIIGKDPIRGAKKLKSDEKILSIFS